MKELEKWMNSILKMHDTEQGAPYLPASSGFSETLNGSEEKLPG